MAKGIGKGQHSQPGKQDHRERWSDHKRDRQEAQLTRWQAKKEGEKDKKTTKRIGKVQHSHAGGKRKREKELNRPQRDR